MSTPEIHSESHGPQEPKAEPNRPNIPGPIAVERRPEPSKHSGRRDPVILIVVAMVISIMLVFGIQRAHKARITTTAGKLQGHLAPDFTLNTPDGRTMKLSDFRGKAVLLNFWATWCEPCKVEMPWFVDLQNKYGPQGLQILGVAMDDASPGEIQSFARKLGVNYPVLLGKEDVGTEYGGLEYLPSTFYIDRSGKIVDHIFGLVSRSEIETDIQKALGQQVASK
ncbi:MAG TPA: TlpA disulfide reductase family protein [Terriglobales bacterium]|nr:TlpA disulfide reductase family protein [Terriglobales bacterium]